MIFKRRFLQTKSLKERLIDEAQNLRDAAKLLPFGPERDAAMRKARQTEAASHMDDWLKLAGLTAAKERRYPRSAMRVRRLQGTCVHFVTYPWSL